MKSIQFLLVLCVLAISGATASPSPSEGGVEEYPEGFVRGLKVLDERPLSKDDTRRKLRLLYEKYDIDHPRQRNLLWFNLGDINIGERLIEIVTDLLGDNFGQEAFGFGDGGGGGGGGGGNRNTVTSAGESSQAFGASSTAGAGGRQQAKGGNKKGKKVRRRY